MWWPPTSGPGPVRRPPRQARTTPTITDSLCTALSCSDNRMASSSRARGHTFFQSCCRAAATTTSRRVTRLLRRPACCTPSLVSRAPPQESDLLPRAASKTGAPRAAAVHQTAASLPSSLWFVWCWGFPLVFQVVLFDSCSWLLSVVWGGNGSCAACARTDAGPLVDSMMMMMMATTKQLFRCSGVVLCGRNSVETRLDSLQDVQTRAVRERPHARESRAPTVPCPPPTPRGVAACSSAFFSFFAGNGAGVCLFFGFLLSECCCCSSQSRTLPR